MSKNQTNVFKENTMTSELRSTFIYICEKGFTKDNTFSHKFVTHVLPYIICIAFVNEEHMADWSLIYV